MHPTEYRLSHPGEFEAENHFYPRVLNAQLHPLVRYFLSLSTEQIVKRYCHMHPAVKRNSIQSILSQPTQHFHWGGADLLHTTNEEGKRQFVVIETNSCPSGQKSMPYPSEHEAPAGYRALLEKSFLPLLHKRKTVKGELAVIFDKNPMEASGYAAVLAELTNEPVHLVPFYDKEETPRAQVREDGILYVRPGETEWIPIRAAFRYVTQRPWNRIPPLTRSMIYNPVLACLAGGRNKMLASKAYDVFNGHIEGDGLRIHTPDTICDVNRDEIPLWIERMGGVAVIKIPYSNAGQGVFTITSQNELAAFMDHSYSYDRFIVQALVGNVGWSSRSESGRLYHVGTIPDKRGKIFVADIRFMIGSGPSGFFPVAIYARRARSPLLDNLDASSNSWDMLGTNLSVKKADGSWSTQKDRLLLMDSRDYNRLGVGVDDLIESFVQTCLSVTAIDRMAQALLTQKHKFRSKLFRSLNPDPSLLEEITL